MWTTEKYQNRCLDIRCWKAQPIVPYTISRPWMALEFCFKAEVVTLLGSALYSSLARKMVMLILDCLKGHLQRAWGWLVWLAKGHPVRRHKVCHINMWAPCSIRERERALGHLRLKCFHGWVLFLLFGSLRGAQKFAPQKLIVWICTWRSCRCDLGLLV